MRDQTLAAFHAANVAFNAKQRKAYNVWRNKVAKATYELVDALEFVDIPTLNDDQDRDKVHLRMQALQSLLALAPWMTKD